MAAVTFETPIPERPVGHAATASEALVKGAAEAQGISIPVQHELHQTVAVTSTAASVTTTPAEPGSRAPRGRLSAWLRRHALDGLLGVLSILGLLAIWYLGTKYRVDAFIRFTNIPTPMEVWDRIIEVNQSTRYLKNLGISVRRILSGFAIACLIGIPLGLLIGRSRWVRGLVFPALEVIRPIPAIAWVPLSIMLWPTNEISIVFITFLGAFFPILLSTINGVHAIDKVLLRAARSLGAGRFALFREVILPGALPHVFTGLAVGMGVAWVSLIAAEMISGQFGVGYFTWEAYSLVQYSEIVLGMLTIGVLGLLCSGVIRMVGFWIMPWRAFATKESDE
jgi:NitT/TauT family transport system permease protein